MEAEHYTYYIWTNSRQEIHRGPYSLEQAKQWLQEWTDDGGWKDTFSLARQQSSPIQLIDDWEDYNG